jgi:hypothetical protein
MADARAGGGCEPRKPLEAGTGERLREAFRASLFEEFVDDAVTAVGALENALPTAITLYDLIRLLYQDIYLTDPVVRSSAITPDLYRSDWALVM